MWKPDGLGELIAERRLTLRRRGLRATVVKVRLGKPVRAADPERGDPWWCPVEVTGFKTRQFTPVAGEDSVQAVVLALQYLTRMLPLEAKRVGGRVDWLGDSERPVFAGTFMLHAYEKAVINLVSGLRLAFPLVEQSTASLARRGRVQAKLSRLLETRGFERVTERR